MKERETMLEEMLKESLAELKEAIEKKEERIYLRSNKYFDLKKIAAGYIAKEAIKKYDAQYTSIIKTKK